MIATLFFLSMLVLNEGGSVGHQNQQIEVLEGHNLTLKCPEQPWKDSLVNYTWDWKRVDDHTNNANSVIYSRRNGRDHPQPQMEQYRNRAIVNQEDLHRGQLTLLIPSVQQADSGQYRCYIPTLTLSCDFTVVVTKDNGTTGEHEFSTTTPAVGGTMDPDAAKERDMVTAISVAVILSVAGIVIGVLVKFKKKWIFKMLRQIRGQDNQYGLVTMIPAKDQNDAENCVKPPADVVIDGLGDISDQSITTQICNCKFTQ